MKPFTQDEWEKLARIWFWLGSSEFWEVTFTNRKKGNRFYSACVANHEHAQQMALKEGAKKK